MSVLTQFIQEIEMEAAVADNVVSFRDGTLKTPYADLLPPLTGDELSNLKASIEAEGVRVPIDVDENDNILDGHHRYRFAPDAPRNVVSGLSDAGKRARVIAVNLQRRNITPKDKKAMLQTQKGIAADLKAEGHTQEQIATMLGVDRTSVSKWLIPNVNAHNRNIAPLPDNRVTISEADKAAICERAKASERQRDIAADFGVSQSTISKILNENGGAEMSTRSGPRLNIPDGETVEHLCRKAIDLEAAGKTAEEAAKVIGVGAQSYRQMRAIVLLSDRRDLSDKDTKVVATALAEMNETRRADNPHKSISAIVARVWGTKPDGRTQNRATGEAARLEHFEHAFVVVIQACSGTSAVDIPYLSVERANGAIKELEEAIKSLRKFMARIKEIRA